jgi:hypothetical protein
VRVRILPSYLGTRAESFIYSSWPQPAKRLYSASEPHMGKVKWVIDGKATTLDGVSDAETHGFCLGRTLQVQPLGISPAPRAKDTFHAG